MDRWPHSFTSQRPAHDALSVQPWRTYQCYSFIPHSLKHQRPVVSNARFVPLGTGFGLGQGTCHGQGNIS